MMGRTSELSALILHSQPTAKGRWCIPDLSVKNTATWRVNDICHPTLELEHLCFVRSLDWYEMGLTRAANTLYSIDSCLNRSDKPNLLDFSKEKIEDSAVLDDKAYKRLFR